MKNRILTRAALVGGLLLSAAAAVSAQDWPQWRGANRDAKVDGFKAPATWPAQLTPKWKQTVGLGDTTPALVGDKLFVLSRVDAEENVICLNTADGKEVWRQKYAAPAVSGPSAGAHSGPRSSHRLSANEKDKNDTKCDCELRGIARPIPLYSGLGD